MSLKVHRGTVVEAASANSSGTLSLRFESDGFKGMSWSGGWSVPEFVDVLGDVIRVAWDLAYAAGVAAGAGK